MTDEIDDFVASHQLVEDIHAFCERCLLDGLNRAREEGIAFFEELARGFVGDWRGGSCAHHGRWAQESSGFVVLGLMRREISRSSHIT